MGLLLVPFLAFGLLFPELARQLTLTIEFPYFAHLRLLRQRAEGMDGITNRIGRVAIVVGRFAGGGAGAVLGPTVGAYFADGVLAPAGDVVARGAHFACEWVA